MRDSELSLDRLLRAAAATTNDRPNEMPFGFDTRVLAGWRAGVQCDPFGLRVLLRRVVFFSLAVIALTSAGTYRELRQSEEASEPFLDQYAIADFAINQAVEP